MKLRPFHHNKKPPQVSGSGAVPLRDTLDAVSVACIAMTPEGEITELNARAYAALRLGGGIFRIR